MIRLIGISGLAGSGKDALAALLPGFTRVAFGDALKDVTRVLFRLTHDQVHGTREQKETIDPCWGIAPREMLQRIGTEVGREGNLREFEKFGISSEHMEFVLNLFGVEPGPGCWLKLWSRRAAGHAYVVVPDVRFPDEAACIRSLGGVVLRVERPGVVPTLAHASEALAFDPDFIIVNDGTLEDLEGKLRSLLPVLWGQPCPR